MMKFEKGRFCDAFLFVSLVQEVDSHLSNLEFNGDALRESRVLGESWNYNDDHFVSIDYALL